MVVGRVSQSVSFILALNVPSWRHQLARTIFGIVNFLQKQFVLFLISYSHYSLSYIVTNSNIAQIVFAKNPMHEDYQNIIFIANVCLLRFEQQIDAEISHGYV